MLLAETAFLWRWMREIPGIFGKKRLRTLGFPVQCPPQGNARHEGDCRAKTEKSNYHGRHKDPRRPSHVAVGQEKQPQENQKRERHDDSRDFKRIVSSGPARHGSGIWNPPRLAQRQCHIAFPILEHLQLKSRDASKGGKGLFQVVTKVREILCAEGEADKIRRGSRRQFFLVGKLAVRGTRRVNGE